MTGVRQVLFAMPVYGGVVRVETMFWLMGEVMDLAMHGINAGFVEPDTGTLISTARAHMFARFAADPAYAGFSDMVFVDWDVSGELGQVRRILEHDADIVAGVYPCRSDPITYTLRYVVENETLRPNAGGLVKVDGCPAGFLRITRKAAEAMVVDYPNEVFYSPNLPDQRAWNLFGEYRIGRVMLQDDYAFCRRARDIGLDVCVDPEMTLHHTGPKTFTGKLGDWLRERGALEASEGAET